MILSAIYKFQAEIFEIRLLVDPGMNDPIVHVFVLFVFLVELLICLLALDVNSIQVPFLYLARQFL